MQKIFCFFVILFSTTSFATEKKIVADLERCQEYPPESGSYEVFGQVAVVDFKNLKASFLKFTALMAGYENKTISKNSEYIAVGQLKKYGSKHQFIITIYPQEGDLNSVGTVATEVSNCDRYAMAPGGM